MYVHMAVGSYDNESVKIQCIILQCVVCGGGKDYHAKNFSRMMKVLLHVHVHVIQYQN